MRFEKEKKRERKGRGSKRDEFKSNRVRSWDVGSFESFMLISRDVTGTPAAAISTRRRRRRRRRRPRFPPLSKLGPHGKRERIVVLP